MRFRYPAALLILMTACIVGSVDARADRLSLVPDDAPEELPDLPGAVDSTPWDINLAERQAALGYDSPIEKWSAKVDRDLGARPGLVLDYARQLSSRFGAGGRYTWQDEYSEIVLNGVYAPRTNLRLRIAGAQLRTSPDYFASTGTTNAFLQHSFLVGARKYWSPDSLVASAGVTAYAARATAQTRDVRSLDDLDIGHIADMNPAGMAPGELNGYNINVRLRPTPVSSLELRREMNQLTYRHDAGSLREDSVLSNGVTFAQRLDNCTHLLSGFSSNEHTDRVDLNLKRNNWQIAISKEQDGGANATAVHVAYALPLGGKHRSKQACEPKSEAVPSFEPLVDAAMTRPVQFPRNPLVIADE